jgi:hypothetical protein
MASLFDALFGRPILRWPFPRRVFVDPFPKIVGQFGYTLQGVMRVGNVSNRNAVNPNLLNDPLGMNGVLKVNLAGATLLPGANGPVDTMMTPLDQIPQLTGFQPDTFKAPINRDPAGPILYPTGHPSNFYAFAEIGFLEFREEEHSIEGWIRGNDGTIPSSDENSHCSGKYKFDDMDGLTGIYTIQFDTLQNHVWDYAFVRISDDEIAISVAGRLPRPAVGTGTLRRLR